MLLEVEVCFILAAVLSGLHLTVDHTRIIPLSVHMVDLCQEGCILKGGVGIMTGVRSRVSSVAFGLPLFDLKVTMTDG